MDYNAWGLSLKRRVRDLRDQMVRLFEEHCGPGLFTVDFYHLDNLCVALEKLYNSQVLNAAPYDQFIAFL